MEATIPIEGNEITDKKQTKKITFHKNGMKITLSATIEDINDKGSKPIKSNEEQGFFVKALSLTFAVMLVIAFVWIGAQAVFH